MNQEELKSKLSSKSLSMGLPNAHLLENTTIILKKGSMSMSSMVPRSLYRAINSNRAVAGLLFQNRSIKTL